MRASQVYFRRIGALLLTVAVLGRGGTRSEAALTLTAQGVAEGFTLSTFATGFPTAQGLGPLGIAFPTSGGVLVSDNAGNVRHFATDTDGQTAASAPVGQNYGVGRAFDMTTSGGNIYLSQRDAGAVIQLNSDGSFNQTIVSGLASPHGIVTNPLNGHLLVSSFTSNNVYDIDPVAHTSSVLFHASLDGITISFDGKTLYGAVAPQGQDRILGYDLTAGNVGNVVFDSGFVPGDPDGTALGTGTLAGKLYANTNGGTIVEIDLATKAQVVIATGGSRGDFVKVDPNNSLLLTQTDTIVRLTPPAGGGFVTTPEPGTLALGAFGIVALLGYGLRRSRCQSARG